MKPKRTGARARGAAAAAAVALSAPALAGVEYGIAASFSRDAGIEAHPSFLFREDFEEATKSQMVSRWEDVGGQSSMSFSADRPPQSGGARSIYITGANGGGDFWRRFSGYDEMHVRFYTKYDPSCVKVHHSVQLWGGTALNPWPAGTTTHAFCSGIEPHGTSWEWGYYTYWPEKVEQWGSGFFPYPRHPVQRGEWHCVELMMKVNTPVTERTGEEAYWFDGVRKLHIGPGFPVGRWLGGFGSHWEATPSGTPFEGMLWRQYDTANMKALWLQHYVDTDPGCEVWFDDVVVATEYIGPLVPAPDTTDPTVEIVSPSDGATTLRPTIDLAGTAEDDRVIVRVSWTNVTTAASGNVSGTTSWSAAGVPLALGANTIRVTAVDPATNTATDDVTVTRFEDTVPPTVAIEAPTSGEEYATYSSFLRMSGLASDNAGVSVVRVTNGTGWRGDAGGTTNWEHASVPLAFGLNVITVTAVDTSGLVATDVLRVTRPTGSAPLLHIVSPTGQSTFTTVLGTVGLAGTAEDDMSVVEVLWENDRGGSGSANGTTSWSIPSVTLWMGTNPITVTARDGDGNTATDTIEVVRAPGGDDDDPPDVAAGILGGPGVCVATGGRGLADVSVRLLTAMGELVGIWRGTELDPVDGAPDVYRIAAEELGLATGVYIAELTLGDGEILVGPAVVVR